MGPCDPTRINKTRLHRLCTGRHPVSGLCFDKVNTLPDVWSRDLTATVDLGVDCDARQQDGGRGRSSLLPLRKDVPTEEEISQGHEDVSGSLGLGWDTEQEEGILSPTWL